MGCPLITSGALPARIVTGIACMALSIPRFVAMEVIESPFPALGKRPRISMMRIVTVVYMAVEAMRTMEPRTSSDENSAHEPIRSVVAIGRTVIW